MTKKAKQRISYVLPLANSPGGHRLGVNGLAVDDENSILYSGGRDGAICAWDLNIDLRHKSDPSDPFADLTVTSTISAPAPRKTTFRAQTQAHTHWVNDLCLVQNNTGLVSASSDLTVRLWRPLSESHESPQTIGQHTDYVKCLATPSGSADWVASGGLDRKINLWDLSGAGKKLEISDEQSSEKGSVYALSVSRSMLASGGPESILRLWDARTGQRITNFMGHTDNIRSILINESEDTIMTASSDQTIKVWSVTAGRCMHTLTMHNDSVWSLFSDDPSLGVFYSGDRSGLVVKTDVRGTMGEFDDGLSVAIAHEHDGVARVVASGGHIWTATASSSINRWTDVETGEDTKLPEVFRHHRSSSASSWSKSNSPPISSAKRSEIPAKSILRISNTASYPVATTRDIFAETNAAGVPLDSEIVMQEPIHRLPEETIEGQHGLVKHKLLNNRYHVLTLDTAGDVVLWDLIRCVPIKSFGKRHIEDVEPELNTVEAVAPWCSVDTRTGRLAVSLEEYNCFDAEVYADKLCLPDPIEFRDDQRINLGKWVLRHLFGNLVDELIKRDEVYLKELREKAEAKKRSLPPSGLQMPPSSPYLPDGSDSATPRGNGHHFPQTPGIGIAVATPGAGLADVPEEGDSNGLASPVMPSSAGGDYFSSTPILTHTSESSKPPTTPYETSGNIPKTPGATDEKDAGKDKENKPANGLKEKDSGIFGKKNKFKMSFGSMKLGRSASTTTAPEPKPATEEKDKSDTDSSENEAKTEEKEVSDSFFGVVQKIHQDYDKIIEKMAAKELRSKIEPSLPEDTPVVKIPDATTVIIQEETSGGSKDLYRGTVGSVGEDADLIVQRAPMWLGEVLLRNTVCVKEAPKISFVLVPYGDELPGIVAPEGTETSATPGAGNNNSRLNANRMLRVRKVLAYVAERIEAAPPPPPPLGGAASSSSPAPAGSQPSDPSSSSAQADSSASSSDKASSANAPDLKPHEYMDLYIHDQKIDKDMTLASMRAHIWKGGADMVLAYRANGRKRMVLERDRVAAAVEAAKRDQCGEGMGGATAPQITGSEGRRSGDEATKT